MNASDINVLDKHGQTVQFNLMKIVRAAWAALMNAGYTRESADKTAEDVSVAVLERVKKFAETNFLLKKEQQKMKKPKGERKILKKQHICMVTIPITVGLFNMQKKIIQIK